MNKPKYIPTLYQTATYQIQIPGAFDYEWFDWLEGMSITVEDEETSEPVTTLTVVLDQAALQGLLRRLYSLGLPLISVQCIENG